MNPPLHDIVLFIQHIILFCGALVILFGVIIALVNYLVYLFKKDKDNAKIDINSIRLRLGRILILGLEFIIAADLIGTTTAPDYYSVGIVACIVLIRTVLSFTINREINSLTQTQAKKINQKTD